MDITKARLKRGLHGLGVLDSALRVRDLARVARAMPRNMRFWTRPSPDGLPLPPSALIYQVAGTADITWFLEAGARAAESIRITLSRNGLDLEDFESILDFGCGCGRVVRHWAGLQAQILGADVNQRAIAWCRRNLPFCRFFANDPAPPLPFELGKFDLVYALSMFTHLPATLQRPWLEELLRVTARGGYVIFSTHGVRYLPDLSPEQQSRFHAGELVLLNEDAAGSNRCGAYHPMAYVRETLTAGSIVVDAIPEGALGNPYQDLFLLRKP
jgi:SAM-dependent methyltransferase